MSKIKRINRDMYYMEDQSINILNYRLIIHDTYKAIKNDLNKCIADHVICLYIELNGKDKVPMYFINGLLNLERKLNNKKLSRKRFKLGFADPNYTHIVNNYMDTKRGGIK